MIPDLGIRIERRIAAPPERVFSAWTSAGEIRRWMGGSDFDISRADIDARVGGDYRIDFRARSGGKVFEHHGRYLEVRPHDLLKFTWISDGTLGRESVVTIELEDLGGATRLRLTHVGLPNADSERGHAQGWGGFMEFLGKHVDPQGRRFDLAQAVTVLRRTPAVLDALLAGLGGDWLEANEGPGTWHALGVVGHLVHAEKTDWMPRVRMILAAGESRPFPPFDRNGHLATASCAVLTDLLAELAALRSGGLAELESLALDEAALDRRGRHPELGTVTLRELIATWVAHDLGHIAQVARVLAKRYAHDVGPWQAYLPVLADRLPSP
jgi:uncharacterized protein YndB with AHSA1/START domain